MIYFEKKRKQKNVMYNNLNMAKVNKYKNNFLPIILISI